MHYTLSVPEYGYRLLFADVFLLLFIMMGPIKSLGVYAVGTSAMQPSERRLLAWKVFFSASVAVLAAGLLGGNLLRKWHIDPAVLQAAGGLVFLLVALRLLLSQYAAAPAAVGGSPPSPASLAFPVTVPPYAFAAVILLVALSHGADRTALVLAVALLVLGLDLLALMFAPRIVRTLGQTTLSIIGAILGVMQVALALQFVVGAVIAITASALPEL
ncbi:MarC family protein [Stenotrophomonas sp.]|uniref:MarC family protein n=1 Tax=Stenotrophomonas sp. TaxID=69392 RepID=UPI0028ABFDF7|nr:MarC family protein [Stenotrophomonas sp.]